MKRNLLRRGIPLLSGLVVLLGFVGFLTLEAGPLPPSGAVSPPAATVVSGVEFSTNAIACPTATTCLAGGSRLNKPNDPAAIVVVNGSNGAPGAVVTDNAVQDGPFNGVGCASASQCLATGFDDVTAVNGANGGIGSNKSVPAIVENAVCPTPTACLAGGTTTASGSFVATLTNVSSSGAPSVTNDIGTGINSSMACVSATRCYAAVTSSTVKDIDVINNGAIAKSIPISEAPIGVSCYQAAQCAVVGNNDGTTYAFTMNPSTGNLGKAQTISGMSNVYAVACANASQCVAVGSVENPLKSAVVDIVNGKVQTAKTVAGITLSGVACSTTTTCWAIGQNTHGVGIIVPAPL